MLPDIVFFGLSLVNFFPPKIFPKAYPPISEKIQTKMTVIKKITLSLAGGNFREIGVRSLKHLLAP